MTTSRSRLSLNSDDVPKENQREIRLKLMELLLPAANRIGLNDPSIIAKKADVLEQYVFFGIKVDKSLSKDNSSGEDVLID